LALLKQQPAEKGTASVAEVAADAEEWIVEGLTAVAAVEREADDHDLPVN
jgi:hypothetical protein